MAIFREMAREWKIEHHGRNARPDHEKLDCFGIPVVNHDSYEVIQKENKPHLQSRVRDYAIGFLNGEVDILLASFQSMYEDPDEQGYQPGKHRNSDLIYLIFISGKFILVHKF